MKWILGKKNFQDSPVWPESYRAAFFPEKVFQMSLLFLNLEPAMEVSGQYLRFPQGIFPFVFMQSINFFFNDANLFRNYTFLASTL
jgi:hypothetical protein